MTTSNAKTESQQLALSGAFEGVTLQKSAPASLTVDLSALNGVDVTIITGGTVQLKAPATEQTNEKGVIHTSVDTRAYNIGDVLPDGWIVGPVSPDTGIVMAIEPVAGALDGLHLWHKGRDHAAELRGKGHANARQPTTKELNAIYNDVVKAGRNDHAQFNTRNHCPHGVYWTCMLHQDHRELRRVQYFSNGRQDWHYKDRTQGTIYEKYHARVRCVRDEPGLKIA